MLLAACAPAVTGYDPLIDRDLECDELAFEISKTRTIEAEAQANRGVSGQNVAWAIFFWPGIIANEMNNGDVMRIADERLFHLYGLYDEKS